MTSATSYTIVQQRCQVKKCLNVRQKLGTRNVLMFKCSEQLLFSCVSSKVSICNYVACRMSHVICQMLMLIVGTSWNFFVFISMLKSRCLLPKIAMVFFLTASSSAYEFTDHRAGSHRKIKTFGQLRTKFTWSCYLLRTLSKSVAWDCTTLGSVEYPK